MKISVALATYNGEQFLQEQLQSIAAQRRQPDELVVCDDASTDATAALVRRFAAESPFEVRLEVNAKNGGASRTFARAVALCRGDIIALCDQDDVWRPEKLARVEEAMSGEPRLGFVFSDAALIDASGRRLPRRLWQAIGFTPRLQRRFDVGDAARLLVKRNLVTGATMAFRSQFSDLLLPIAGHWIHDAWFALLLAAVAPCRALREPLIEYRQHDGQQIGALKAAFYERFQRAAHDGRERLEQGAADFDAARQRLLQFRARLADAMLPALLAEKAQHLRARSRIRASLVCRLPGIASELLRGRYARFSENYKAVVQDLLL
ncbi:MAG: glycosyltransferase family 2 protein [Thermoguttaceae bacterium]